VAGDVKRLFSDLQHLIGLIDAKVTHDGPTAQYEAICGPIAGRISYTACSSTVLLLFPNVDFAGNVAKRCLCPPSHLVSWFVCQPGADATGPANSGGIQTACIEPRGAIPGGCPCGFTGGGRVATVHVSARCNAIPLTKWSLPEIVASRCGVAIPPTRDLELSRGT
jgi:hypothetical protein